ICSALATGRDVALTDLPARARALAELGELRVQLRRLREQLGLTESTRELEARDWSVERGRAEGLLRVLDLWGRDRPLAPGIGGVLSSADSRRQAEEALRRADAARTRGLDEGWQFLVGLFDTSQEVSTGIVLAQASLADLRQWLVDRIDATDRV